MIDLIENKAAEIFTTDEIAACMMACVKSNYSWDVEIKMFNGVIFLDKREDENGENILNYDTVCESAIDF